MFGKKMSSFKLLAMIPNSSILRLSEQAVIYPLSSLKQRKLP